MKEQSMPMSKIQLILWKLADAEIRKIGGFAGISRNQNPDIRLAGKTKGTREWALLKCAGLASGIITDKDCQYLIDCITNN